MSRRTLEDRFWAKVEKRGADECWEWTGALANGYGRFRIGSQTDGSRRLENAHRIAFELVNGPIPSDHLVCHRCDNPLCCNPAHLFTGTHADNSADMVAKDRGYRPRFTRDAHPNRKLTEAQVARIKRQYAGRYGEQSALAREFGVSPTLIRQLVTN